jgi:hypothetical protein
MYRNLPRLVRHVLKQKIIIAPLLKILPLGFKHVLCGKILYVNKSIFCTTMSFVVIVIMAIVIEDKLNIIVT